LSTRQFGCVVISYLRHRSGDRLGVIVGSVVIKIVVNTIMDCDAIFGGASVIILLNEVAVSVVRFAVVSTEEG
jgi:hypothetical protein